MNTSKVHLATSSEEISKHAQVARNKNGDRVILVPVDFSVHSEAALVYACELADIMPAAVMVLHVVHDPGEMPGYYSKLIKKKRVGRIQDTAAEAFDEFTVRVSEAHPNLTALQEAQRLMVVGLPVTRILEVVKELNPTMVIVGSQGRTGMKHLFIGSKAAQIVQLSPVPVTVVKSKKPKKKK